MRYFISIGLLFALSLCVLFSCEKYKDTKAASDPRLTNPYCNDPTAVNYNWGFPGKPDSSVCFYPTDVFNGVYEVHDSVYLLASGLYIYADTFVMTIHKLTDTTMSVLGFCSNIGDSLLFKAGPLYVATLDTLIGDSITTSQGQMFCSINDTVSGTLTKDRINDSLLYISFQVSSDTGVIVTHVGTAYKK